MLQEQIVRDDERENEQQTWMQQLADLSPGLLYLYDGVEERLLYLNERSRELLGYSPQALIDRGANVLHSLIHPEDIAQFSSHLRALQAGSTLEIEYRIQHASGEWRWFRSRDRLWRCTPQGQVQQILGAAEDITERKRTEEALRESQELLQGFMNCSPVLFCIKDERGHYVYVNPSVEQLVNCKSPDILGRTDGDFFSADTAQQLRAHDREVIAQGKPIQFLETLQIGDRPYHYLSFKFSFRDASGQNLLAVISLDISDRIQAEEALSRREEELRLIANALPVLISRVDAEQRYRFNNRGYEEWYGHSPTEIYGKTLWEVMGNSAYENIRPYVEQALSGKSVTYESQLTLKDAGKRYISASYIPQRDRQGQVVGFVALVSDISSRKQAEAEKQQLLEQLGTERELLEAVLQQMPAGVMVAEAPSGKITLSNEQIQEIWTNPPTLEHFGHLSQYPGFHRDGRPYQIHEWPLVRSVQRGEVVTGEEIHFIRNDGSSGIMLVNAAPIRDRHNQIKAGVVTFYDISDRQQMEAALRDREHRFSTLFNGMEDWVLVYHLSPEGTPSQLIEVNEQACHKLGYSREELLQMSVTEIIDSTSVTPLVTLEKLKSEKHVVIESVHRTKAGQCIPVEVSATLFTLNGLPTVQSICRDITERKRAEAEREQLWEWERQARAQAEDANRIKDEFLAVLSHELRSPLNPILGWVRLLRSRQFDSATTDKALEIIERNTKLQAQLIEDLLDVSRILQGKMLLNVIALNMIVPLEGALETVRLAAEAKAIALETHLEAGEVLGDPMRLQQAMWNLLSNAIKFTPPGGRIEVRLQTIGDELQIQIKDSGKGIAPAFVPHVFEYFRQEDGSTTRQFGGLGLGLAIVRHLVELHGGRIYAESAGEGLGATFTVRLPRLLSQPPADSAGEVRVVPWRDSCENLAPLAGLRVLVVDDEPDMRDLLGVVLQQWGAEVQVAASAREALGLISRLPFDLVISDIGMPEMDGYQLMRQLRSRLPEQGSQVKAIALTAYAGEWNQQQALAAGFHKHLAKPVTPEVLLEAIATLLED
ncbi:PAS domain S-box protein [Desertifilum sp. FACHB-1129]|uniref:histidine kinase n=1 Tax=Desertifilum tharense IPPAS B-1220 TaxID=1781255 RepID=A0A1E5QHW7_9CYAN|nr:MULTISPECIES: PAS domain S-box protein [Desertifilum]MDA0209461.1 PAS domain S-box protein [Cyanobacteria bacterium FC1]MBD2314340.1 PAS domain S-box protein [Desertifilum sp. FACHB-1129]MBD2324617.1 PAS domain S-box protein [Desertifilum sp. FACHB-866]MBD2334708.1 PAS domain S-box protein [Desertifilum sp. FACHB-868]OEJ74275.1 hypothetical protein BH720_15460 [Desertifilum tharense IPPAS B-1220]